MIVVPDQSKRTISLKNSGQPAIIKVSRQTFEVRDFDVQVSMSSRSFVTGLCMLIQADIFPMSTKMEMLWQSGNHKMAVMLLTLHWRLDDRLTEGLLQFRVPSLPHLVYPSAKRVALFLVDLS